MNLIKQKMHSTIIGLPLILMSLLPFSCGENSSSSHQSESELINKVNAVQEQMMKQGNISEEERQAILSLAKLVANEEDFSSSEDLADVIEFDDVENSPVYPGCEGLSQKETKQCFIDNVNELVEAQFNTKVAKELGISESKKVEVFFKVDKDGGISNLKVRDANVVIQAEALRVIKQLPVMKPATQKGEAVDVMCSTTISYGGK